MSSLFLTLKVIIRLALPDSEHLSSACGTCTLSSWLAVLHGYALGVFHLSLGATFDTVRLH